jgi:4-amino-4-deoxy-L-arabinose transferase-like glycosyltransferase
VYSRNKTKKNAHFSLCLAQVFKKDSDIHSFVLSLCVRVRANNLFLFFFFFISSPFFKNSTIQHITYNIVLAFCFIVYTGLFLSFSCILFAFFFCAAMTKKKKKLCIFFCCFCFLVEFVVFFHSY